jgi:hypothetical protein
MSRRTIAALTAIVLALAIAAPVVAQDEMYVSVQDPSFSWTGKQDQQANFSWSASIDNPTKRPATVMVTLHLMDADGAIVGSDSQTIAITKQSNTDVGGNGSLAYASASQATQYRVTVEGVEN